MSIRSTHTTRNLDSRKASVPTIGRGIPSNKEGVEGDIAFRATPDGLKLYIKANSKWQGVKVGESFDSLERQLSEMNSKINFVSRLNSSNTLNIDIIDSERDIELNADGGQVTIKDDTANHFLFDCDNTALTIYDDQDEGDLFKIQVDQHGATTVSTVDDDSHAADLTIDIDGTINLDSEDGITNFKNSGTVMGVLTSNRFRLFHSTDQADWFSVDVAASGATTISTVDDGAAVGHLTLDPDGELNLTPVTEVKSDAPLKIKEAGAAVADTDTYGQIWVKNTDPETLFFTDGGGTDKRLDRHIITFNDFKRYTLTTVDDHYAGYQNYYTGTTDLTGNLAQGTADTLASASHALYYGKMVPYAGTIIKFRAQLLNNMSSNPTTVNTDIWKVSPATDGGMILVASAFDHIGTIQFPDASDGTYIHTSQNCSSLDATAAAFSEGDYLLITARRAGGSDSTYAFINSVVVMEVPTIG